MGFESAVAWSYKPRLRSHEKRGDIYADTPKFGCIVEQLQELEGVINS